MLKSAIELDTERGGVFIADIDSGTLTCPDSVQKGETSEVTIDHGIVEWHTHPTTCDLWTRCGISAPSAKDMSSIVVDVMNGNRVHMVFARDSTYIVRVGPVLERLMLAAQNESDDALEYAGAAIDHVFDMNQKRLSLNLQDAKSNTAYTGGFLDSWLHLSKLLGFEVNVIHGGLDRKRPTVALDVWE